MGTSESSARGAQRPPLTELAKVSAASAGDPENVSGEALDGQRAELIEEALVVDHASPGG